MKTYTDNNGRKVQMTDEFYEKAIQQEETKNAKNYIEDSVSTSNFKNVSEIAWRFLIGNRILECLDELGIKIQKGMVIDKKVVNQEDLSSTLTIGNISIHIKAIKPNVGDEIPK